MRPCSAAAAGSRGARSAAGRPSSAYAVVGLILLLVLAPHIGLFLLSIATVWSFSPLPDGYTLAHYTRVFGEVERLHQEHAALCHARRPDRRRARRGHRLSRAAHHGCRAGTGSTGRRRPRLPVPGVVLGIGYLRTFFGIKMPDGTSLASFWIVIVLALAIRRLPYALRACYAALQQVSRVARGGGGEPRRHQAAHRAPHRGAVDDGRHARRVRDELRDRRGRTVGDADAGAEQRRTRRWPTASTCFMQSPAGRGPGAALGIIAVVLVAVCSLVSQLDHRAQRSTCATRAT